MIESKPHQLNGLAIQHEHTSFRLTDDEMRWLTDNEYYRLPVNAESNILTKTSFLLKDKRLNRVKQFFDERMNNYIENVVEIKNIRKAKSEMSGSISARPEKIKNTKKAKSEVSGSKKSS